MKMVRFHVGKTNLLTCEKEFGKFQKPQPPHFYRVTANYKENEIVLSGKELLNNLKFNL